MDTKNISSINFSLFFRWILSRLHCIYRVIYIKTIPFIIVMANAKNLPVISRKRTINGS